MYQHPCYDFAQYLRHNNYPCICNKPFVLLGEYSFEFDSASETIVLTHSTYKRISFCFPYQPPEQIMRRYRLFRNMLVVRKFKEPESFCYWQFDAPEGSSIGLS